MRTWRARLNAGRWLPSGFPVPASARLRIRRLSLARQFMVASMLTLVASMVGIDWWLGRQIKESVILRTAATTALYVDSYIASNVFELGEQPTLLFELGEQPTLTDAHRAMLGRLLRDTPLGQQLAGFKIWTPEGRILYSANQAGVGQVFPVEGNLAQALQGKVAARISDLDAEENVLERGANTQLLEIYSPIRQHNTGRVIAVAEFYQRVDDLQREITAAQHRSWLLVAGVTLLMYVLLAGFIHYASTTIERQRVELSAQVTRLTDLLGQNGILHERVRRAAAGTAALNERFLRRISADLHDGPVQDLGLALLQLDHVVAHCEACRCRPDQEQANRHLDDIQASMRHAMQEIRAISVGLNLPELKNLTLTDTIRRVIRTHERRTGTQVALHLDTVPAQASLPVKITLYRFIQESLQNAYRHAQGIGQEVRISCTGEYLTVAVIDHGPGFAGMAVTDHEQHLGLVGMRERVESLGGTFQVDSRPGHGTTVSAHLALQAEGGMQ